MSYLFNEMNEFSELLIVFLCGTKYKRHADNDKRIIMKKYLQKKNAKVIILEEHFLFGKSNKKYLSYNEIFMKNLQDVEMLTASFAKKIFIIHESISTGAELAVFASNDFLHEKLCILVPDSTGIEEEKISTFLKLAYFQKESNIHKITFYPETYVHEISTQHVEIRTNFNNNSISQNLSLKIDEFLQRKMQDDIEYIRFSKMKYAKPDRNLGIISYRKIGDKVAEVYISARVVLYQVISLFSDDDFRREVRTVKKLTKHVDYIFDSYKDIMKDTISEFLVNHLEAINIIVKEVNIKVRNVIAYALYILQALDAIKILQLDNNGIKFEISSSFSENIGNYNSLVVKKKLNVTMEQ